MGSVARFMGDLIRFKQGLTRSCFCCDGPCRCTCTTPGYELTPETDPCKCSECGVCTPITYKMKGALNLTCNGCVDDHEGPAGRFDFSGAADPYLVNLCLTNHYQIDPLESTCEWFYQGAGNGAQGILAYDANGCTGNLRPFKQVTALLRATASTLASGLGSIRVWTAGLFMEFDESVPGDPGASLGFIITHPGWGEVPDYPPDVRTEGCHAGVLTQIFLRAEGDRAVRDCGDEAGGF